MSSYIRHATRYSFPVFMAFLVSLLSGCGYNQIQSDDEAVKASWAEVLNQYKRRADLIPNLVNVVKGYAAHERDVLVRVTEARAGVGGLNMTPEMLDDPEAMAKFGKAQGELSSALSRLLVVTENYPNLKADLQFRELAAQIEGTENRVTVARNRFISSVQAYNANVRSFPTNLMAMMFGYKVKPTFVVEDEKAISDAPKVDFGGSSSVSTSTGAR